jgi:hypothetical protein
MFERAKDLFKDFLLVFTRGNTDAHTLSPPGDGGVEDRFARITRIDVVRVTLWLHRLAGTLFRGHEFLDHLRIVGHHGSDNEDGFIVGVFCSIASTVGSATIGIGTRPTETLTPSRWVRRGDSSIGSTLAFLSRTQTLTDLVDRPSFRIRAIGDRSVRKGFLLIMTVGTLNPTEQA